MLCRGALLSLALALSACSLDETSVIPELDALSAESETSAFPLLPFYFGRGEYRSMGAFIKASGRDLETDAKKLVTTWPLRGKKTAAVARQGTPQLWWLPSVRGPQHDVLFYHNALDVTRARPNGDAEVLAPIAGDAVVVHYVKDGKGGHFAFGPDVDDYGTFVLIWDPDSHYLVSLLHVRPLGSLRDARHRFVRVARGQQIGTLAETPLNVGGDERRHAHVNLYDGGADILHDPALNFGYRDSVAPHLAEAYLLDGEHKAQRKLHSGKIDLAVVGYDRDDDSHMNFELAAIEYELVADDGTVLAELERCDLTRAILQSEGGRIDDLYDVVTSPRHPRVPTEEYKRASYRYVVSQLARDSDAECRILPASEGWVDIPARVRSAVLRARAWDAHGNSTEFRTTLRR